MQFESLKIFCDIARQRSFSRAAQANGITQSAASHTVHQLEKRVGMVSVPRKTRVLVALPWLEEEMVVACAPSHVFTMAKSIRPGQLAAEKLIAFDKNLQIRREVDRFLKEHGVAVSVVAEFDNIE